MWIAILKQEFPKVIKGRFKQESGGANSVTAISKCTNKIYFVLAWSEGIPFSIKASKRLSLSLEILPSPYSWPKM